mgnify:CR=1 FL=1
MKKRTKEISMLCCLLLIVTMLAGIGTTEVKAEGSVIEVGTWQELQNAINSCSTDSVINIRLTDNLTAGDEDYCFWVDAGNITIDLAGYTIDRNQLDKEASIDGYVFYVKGQNTVLKLTDSSEEKTGTVRGGYCNSDCGAGVRVGRGAQFILESGTISDNRTDDYVSRGAGVYVDYQGTFLMTGGKITGNHAQFGAGVMVLSQGKFIMTGGEITGNIADAKENYHLGAGVYIYCGSTFTVGGSAKIYGNTSAEGKPSNLYLGNYLNDLEISLSDTTSFTSDARIGISLAKDATTRFTSTGAEWKDVFVSDDEKFEIKTVDGEEGIYFTKKEDSSSGGQNPINPEPSNPEQPTNPEPSNPEQPTNPEPSNPEQPTNPEPSNSEQPTNPEPSNPEQPTNPEPSNPEQPTDPESTTPEQKEEVSTTVTETAGENLVSPKTADCNTIFACTVLIVDMLLASIYFYKKSKRQ